MPTIKLKYHNSLVEVPEPPGRFIGTIEGNEIPPLDNPQKSILDALENPIDSMPLKAMIPPDGRITIMVSDRTRNTRLDLLLPLLLDYLRKSGVSEDRILIMVCLGTHKCHTDEGLVQHVGKNIFDICCVKESNHEEDSDYVFVGTTPRGTKVRFRKEAVDSKLLIVTGGITFHYFAGFSGGRKSFIPGIASNNTIQQNHRMTYVENSEGKFVRNLNCTSGKIDGNPVSEDMEDAFRLMPTPSFLLNVIVNPKGEITNVYTGNVIKAHRKGASDFAKMFSVPIKERADLVIASAGGYPTDINLLQSHKSILNASTAVKPEGRVLVFAHCVEGINLGSYPDFVREHGHEKLVDELQRNYEIVGGTTDNLMAIAKSAEVYLVSNLSDEDVKNFGMVPFYPEKDGWEKVYDNMRKDSSYYIMPNASKFLPIPPD